VVTSGSCLLLCEGHQSSGSTRLPSRLVSGLLASLWFMLVVNEFVRGQAAMAGLLARMAMGRVTDQDINNVLSKMAYDADRDVEFRPAADDVVYMFCKQEGQGASAQ
jgi:hypothetical protein